MWHFLFVIQSVLSPKLFVSLFLNLLNFYNHNWNYYWGLKVLLWRNFKIGWCHTHESYIFLWYKIKASLMNLFDMNFASFILLTIFIWNNLMLIYVCTHYTNKSQATLPISFIICRMKAHINKTVANRNQTFVPLPNIGKWISWFMIKLESLTNLYQNKTKHFIRKIYMN